MCLAVQKFLSTWCLPSQALWVYLSQVILSDHRLQILEDDKESTSMNRPLAKCRQWACLALDHIGVFKQAVAGSDENILVRQHDYHQHAFMRDGDALDVLISLVESAVYTYETRSPDVPSTPLPRGEPDAESQSAIVVSTTTTTTPAEDIIAGNASSSDSATSAKSASADNADTGVGGGAARAPSPQHPDGTKPRGGKHTAPRSAAQDDSDVTAPAVVGPSVAEAVPSSSVTSGHHDHPRRARSSTIGSAPAALLTVPQTTSRPRAYTGTGADGAWGAGVGREEEPRTAPSPRTKKKKKGKKHHHSPRKTADIQSILDGTIGDPLATSLILRGSRENLFGDGDGTDGSRDNASASPEAGRAGDGHTGGDGAAGDAPLSAMQSLFGADEDGDVSLNMLDSLLDLGASRLVEVEEREKQHQVQQAQCLSKSVAQNSGRESPTLDERANTLSGSDVTTAVTMPAQDLDTQPSTGNKPSGSTKAPGSTSAAAKAAVSAAAATVAAAFTDMEGAAQAAATAALKPNSKGRSTEANDDPKSSSVPAPSPAAMPHVDVTETQKGVAGSMPSAGVETKPTLQPLSDSVEGTATKHSHREGSTGVASLSIPTLEDQESTPTNPSPGKVAPRDSSAVTMSVSTPPRTHSPVPPSHSPEARTHSMQASPRSARTASMDSSDMGGRVPLTEDLIRGESPGPSAGNNSHSVFRSGLDRMRRGAHVAMAAGSSLLLTPMTVVHDLAMGRRSSGSGAASRQASGGDAGACAVVAYRDGADYIAVLCSGVLKWMVRIRRISIALGVGTEDVAVT